MLAALNSWAFAPPPAEPEPSPRYGLNSEWEPRPRFDWTAAYIAEFATSYSYQAELDAEMSQALAQDEVPLPSYSYEDDGLVYINKHKNTPKPWFSWYEDDGTIRPSYSYEDDGTAWPSYSYDTEDYRLQQEESKELNREYDEAVQWLEKWYRECLRYGTDWWNEYRPEPSPSPSPDPPTHGWANEWSRLWEEMQRKQRDEIEARLQPAGWGKMLVDRSRLWADPQAELDAADAKAAEAAKQDVKVMTFKEVKQWYWECVRYGGVVVEPEGLEDDGPLCEAGRADGWDGW